MLSRWAGLGCQAASWWELPKLQLLLPVGSRLCRPVSDAACHVRQRGLSSISQFGSSRPLALPQFALRCTQHRGS